jgi:hypothetical protein
VRPAFLELRETGADAWDVHWRVPARGDLRLSLAIRLPADCTDASPRRASLVEAMHSERWSVRCEEDLAGREVAIEGLARTVTDVLVRVVREDGSVQTARVLPARPSFTVEAAAGPLGVARTYAALGVEHILMGLDHLLFVLGLLVLVEGTGRLVRTITAFTLAHSLTLAAATLGWIRVPAAPVEAVVALSIVFVAREILELHAGRAALTAARPWLVAFAFGLLHGLGFAGALRQAGLPGDAIPAALLFFNVGVEIGQLAFVAAVLPVVAAVIRLPGRRPVWTWQALAYGIGSIAAGWTLQRVAGFWG